jgi:raffinose/stachyose/melibiose transport system substrate-binding protein
MKTMKKFPYAVCVLLLAAILIAGCAGAQPAAPAAAEPTAAPAAVVEPTKAPEPTVAPVAKQNVTITYMASQDWIKNAELELSKKFEDQTGIHVDYQIIPADQYFSVLKTKLNSGEATDIFGGQSGKSDLKLQYDVEKNAVDLTGEEWTKRHDPLALDMLTLDGKVYGAEIWDIVAANYFIVNYNKDIFAKLGLSVPKTYAEFKDACVKIKAAGITPIYEPVSDGWHHVLWFPMVGPRYEEAVPGLAEQLNANKASVAGTPIMVQALTQLKELYDLGCFGDNALSDTYADTGKQLASGQYAMSVATLTEPVAIEKDYPDVKATSFGFFPMPLVDNTLAPAHPAGPSKFIYAGSKHIEEAKQYLAFLMQPENLQYLLDNTPEFASLDFTGLKDKWTPEQKAFLDAYPAKSIVYQDAVNYLNPQWMDMGKDLTAMFTGAMTPEDVAKSIDQRRADMAKTAKDPAWQ